MRRSSRGWCPRYSKARSLRKRPGFCRTVDVGRRCERRRCDPSWSILPHRRQFVKRGGAGAQRRSRPGSRPGALRPLRLPGRPARRAPAPTTHPHTPHPSRLPVYHSRRLLCVSGGYGKQLTPPCMPSASDGRCGRGLPRRRRRYDGRNPRPAAAVLRRSGFVTPRPLPAQGRAGGWAEASLELTGTASAPLAAAVDGVL